MFLYRQDELFAREKDQIALHHDDTMSDPLALVSRRVDKQIDRDYVYSQKVLMKKTEPYHCRFIGVGYDEGLID